MRGTHFAELSAFVAVAEHASFTKAAAHLRISTATLSQTIRTLEDRLGVRLLNRTTRSVAPTDAGERLLTQLRPLLDELDAAIDSVNAFRDKPAGHLRLTVPPPIATHVLAPLLAPFHAQYPEIIIEISVDAKLTDIVAGRFDAGIRMGHRVARDMIAVRITKEMPYVVVAAPDYLSRHIPPKTPRDLEAHNCIRLRFPSGGFLPWRFAEDDKIVEFDVEGSVIVNEEGLAVRAARDGIGVFYWMEDYVAPLIADRQLARLLEEYLPPPSEGFFLYYPSRRQNTAALQVLIDFLRANLRVGVGASARSNAARGEGAT